LSGVPELLGFGGAFRAAGMMANNIRVSRHSGSRRSRVLPEIESCSAKVGNSRLWLAAIRNP
jgi:hypothetical protein